MKRTFTALCALVMLLALSSRLLRCAMAEADEDGCIQGTCGDELIWYKTLGGALLISGTGPMYDYEECGPWGTDIVQISFNPDVTSIGANAFRGCSKLESVWFNDRHFDYIGDHAFADCPSDTVYGVACQRTVVIDALTKQGLANQLRVTHHNSIGKLPAVEPTCTESGLTEGRGCLLCRKYVEMAQQVIPALGHTEEIISAGDPTCTDTGLTEGVKCSVCSEVLTAQEVIPAKGHAYDDGVQTIAPTYTKEGVKTFTCTSCGDTCTETIPPLDYNDSNPYKGKVFSIMGDSISTFAGYIPTADGFNRTHLARYPQSDLLTDVYETWWMQTIVDLQAKLGINDSWRGATVSGAHAVTSGDTGENAAMSNLVRIQNLGSNGTPDVILFYGGTNDIAHVSKIGSFDPDSAPSTVDLTTAKWDNLADGYAHTLLRMKHYYPDAVILALLPTYTASYYSDARLAQANETLVDICEYYGVPYIDLRDSGITADDLPDGIHPGEHGMDLITSAVIDALLTIDVPEGENTVYSVTHNLSNATASRGYYKGVSAGTSFEETLTGDDLSVTVTMGGKDITSACYSNGVIFIEKVTGALEITARSPFSLGDHLQEIPSEAYNNTNLWQVLKPEKGYFKGAEWVNNYSSVTIPVTAGDQLWATSFGASGKNGGSMNGIRVTYFDAYGMLATIEPDAVYEEFQQNSHLTVPEGATAVCITMWTNTNAELYLLTLPDGPVLPGNHLQEIPSPVCSGINLWQVLEPEKGYFKGATWVDYYSSVTIPVTAGDQLWATSFGASGENGGTINGIRVTYFDVHGMLVSLEATEVYEEFRRNGHITVPENAVSVNVVMWNGDASDELYILNLEHSYDNGIETAAPSCIADGTMTFTCEICGGTSTEAIPATGHTEETIPAVAPTCTNTGLTEGSHCSACNEVLIAQEGIDALGHSYEAVSIVPTPTAKGYSIYTCSRCSDSYCTPWLHETAYKGLKIACVGDSITAAYGVTKDKTDYVTLLAQKLGMDYIRLGASGTTLCTDGSRTCNIGQLTESKLNGADVVTILMGINDFCAAGEGYYELGDINSRDTSTIYGAMRMWCERIEQLQKTASLSNTKFYFVTPVICSWNNSVTSGRNWDQSKTNIHGYTLRDLCNAIIEVANCYDICVIDLNILSGMYYIDAANNNTAVFGGDGVHPGEKGHAMMADALANILLQNDLRDDHSHVFGSWITTAWPSCLAGEQQRVCTICSATEDHTLEPNGNHHYRTVVTAATCETAGYTTYTCSTCGDSYVADEVAATGHSYDDGVVTTAPTCTAGGVKIFTCETCGDSYNEIVSATGHMEEALPAVAPTCTDTGLTAGVKCSVCDEILTSQTVVAALGHSYTPVTTAPTCTEKGYTTYTCHCGDSYTADEVAALGHRFDEGVETTPPTCTEEGVKTFTCEVCADAYTEAISAASHTEEIIPAVAPTCTDAGLTAGTKCSVCGGILAAQEEVSALGHNYLPTITDSTCTGSGYTTYICSACNDSYTADETPATGHSYDDGLVTTAPTCTAEGIKTFTCSACGVSYTESLPATGHTEETLPAVAPTCTETGLTAGVICSACGEILTVQTEVAALGHSYDDGVETTTPTCTAEGIKTFTCTVCGNACTEGIAATGHNYESSVTGSTCTGIGYTTYTCSACGDRYTTDETPAAGHSYDDGVVTTAPTCTEEGIKTFTCSACGASYTEPVPATGHTQETIPAVAPTCTETGLTAGVKCSVCGEILTAQTEVPALGHSYDDGVETTTPTCTEEGIKTFTCTVCSNACTEVISATGHSYEPSVTGSTCTGVGYTTYTCSACGDSYTTDETPASGHSYDDGVVTTVPTCTAEGIKTFTCSTCGASYTESVPATGHTQETIPAIAPTCTKTGLTAGVKCSVCGEILTAQTQVPALGHSYNSGVETTTPSCTVAGMKTFTCIGCGEYYTEAIPSLGHAETVLPAVTPTCTTVGQTEGLHCSVCGTVFTPQEILPALGHTEGEPVITVEPTAQTAGIRSVFCVTCSELIRSESITMTGSLYIPGDADESGHVDLYDALLVMQYSAGWDVTPNLLNADISKDGSVGLYDAVMILQYCAGTSFDSALRALLEKAEELSIAVMTILEHPQDQQAIEGQQAVFRLSAAGAGLQYQWYIDRGNGDGWRPIAGATSDTYTIIAAQMTDDGCRYRCGITDASGRQIMSNPATLYVEPAVELPPTGDQSALLLWTTLMAVSLCGLIGLVAAGKRHSMSK